MKLNKIMSSSPHTVAPPSLLLVLLLALSLEIITETESFSPNSISPPRIPRRTTTATTTTTSPFRLASTLSDRETAAKTSSASASSSSGSGSINRRVLVPPRSLEEILCRQGETEELYSQSVQKTYGRFPLVVKNGKGCFLYATNGMEYLDCVSGIATCALGHANDDLARAVAEQMKQVHHVSNLYYIPQQAVLADWLVQNTFTTSSTTTTIDTTTTDTSNLANKVFFCNSGVEANEAAIKLARRRVWVKNGGQKNSNNNIKPIILTATNSFHGRTITAISASGQRKYHTIVDKSTDTVRRDDTNGFGYDGKMVPGFRFVPFNDVAALKQAVAEIQASNGDGQVLAAIMMEALQGEGGMHPGTVEYFQAIRDICNEHDALMICDEVQVGMGRSGKLWGWQNVLLRPGDAPDIVASAKALGGGIPLGAMIASGRALNVVVNDNDTSNDDSTRYMVPVWGPGDHASTYGGNPLACRAGLAVAQYYCEHDILHNVQARGEQLGRGLQALCQKYPQLLQEMRGWGLMRGVQVAAAANATAGANDDDVVIPPTRLVQAALDEGLLIVAAGAKVVRFVPPLIISEAQVDMALERFERAILKIMEQEKATLFLE